MRQHAPSEAQRTVRIVGGKSEDSAFPGWQTAALSAFLTAVILVCGVSIGMAAVGLW